MKILTIFTLIFSLHTQAALISDKILPKVIYGTDDRLDVFECSDSLMREIAKSTAAQVSNEELVKEGSLYSLHSPSYKDWARVCSDERFSHQVAAANCSGFLVGPDLLVTAGHCIYSVTDCQMNSWVFDYANPEGERDTFSFKENQVYHCTEIVDRQKDSDTMNDYAIVRLDRKVTGRSPLKYRTRGKISSDAVLTVIGHPGGVPQKITVGAEVRDNLNSIFFTINSDTYVRNSGSVVVDTRTGIVEGILVRGDTDFKPSLGEEDCSVSVVHDKDGGSGEGVTRITNLKKLAGMK